MLTGAQLAAARAVHESIMVGTCTIRTPGTRVLNQTTSTYDVLPGSLVYTGKCLLQSVSQAARFEQTAGGQVVRTGDYVLKLPVESPDYVLPVEPDHLVEALSSNDAELVGRRLVVVTVEANEYATARRVVCIHETP